MRTSTALLTTLATAGALLACGDSSTDPDGNGGGGTTGDDGTVVIRMQNTAFIGPDGSDDVSVPVGTKIEWQNRDAVQHTATSTEVPPGGEGFHTGPMDQGSTRSFTPMVEGTWTYMCQVHPGIMVGATITATAAGTGSGESAGDDGEPQPGDPGY